MVRSFLPFAVAVWCTGYAQAQQVAQVSSEAEMIVQQSSQTTRINLSLQAIPDAAESLTLQAALERALASSPQLSAARQEQDATAAAVLQADVLPNPSLEAGMEDTRSQTRETTLVLSQPIELGGKRQARVRAAQSERDLAAMDLELKRADISAAVIAAFFDVLAEQERLTLAREALELARRASQSTAGRVAAGKVSPVEESRARVAEAGVRIELLQARTALSAARKRLALLWGETEARFGLVEGSMVDLPPLPALPSSTQAALLADRAGATPGMRRAQAEVLQRQAMLEVERTRRVPDLTVSLGARRSAELGRNQAIIGLAMPLPVFDSNHGNILASQKRLDKARDELAGTRQRIATELAIAGERFDSLRVEAGAMVDEVLPGALSAYNAASTGFEYGKFAFLDVLDAQRTLLAARLQYLRTLAEAHRTAADMGRLLGLSLNTVK